MCIKSSFFEENRQEGRKKESDEQKNNKLEKVRMKERAKEPTKEPNERTNERTNERERQWNGVLRIASMSLLLLLLLLLALDDAHQTHFKNVQFQSISKTPPGVVAAAAVWRANTGERPMIEPQRAACWLGASRARGGEELRTKGNMAPERTKGGGEEMEG